MNIRNEAPPRSSSDTRPRVWVRLLVFAAVVVALLAASRFLPMTEWMTRFLEWVRGLGMWGPIALGVAYVLATVLFVPGFLLTLGAGALFGVVVGSVTVSIASTIGATAAFLIGRYAARDAVAARAALNPSFAALDQAVATDGWKIVGLVRLSPIFPYNLVNYAFGLTHVSLRDYVVASAIGMLPATILYVYLGAALGDAVFSESERERTEAEWAFYALGLLATIGVTVYITRAARKALAQALASSNQENAQ